MRDASQPSVLLKGRTPGLLVGTVNKVVADQVHLRVIRTHRAPRPTIKNVSGVDTVNKWQLSGIDTLVSDNDSRPPKKVPAEQNTA